MAPNIAEPETTIASASPRARVKYSTASRV